VSTVTGTVDTRPIVEFFVVKVECVGIKGLKKPFVQAGVRTV